MSTKKVAKMVREWADNAEDTDELAEEILAYIESDEPLDDFAQWMAEQIMSQRDNDENEEED